MQRKSRPNSYLETYLKGWISEVVTRSFLGKILEQYIEKYLLRDCRKKKNWTNFFWRVMGPKYILHFQYNIAMHCNVLLSATPINADDAN